MVPYFKLIALLFIITLVNPVPSNAQVTYKENIYSVLDTFSEGLAFAAISQMYYDVPDNSHFNNTVGYIDTTGNWVIRLPENLTNLYMGCFFRGKPFKNGKAQMDISENGFDCNCSAGI